MNNLTLNNPNLLKQACLINNEWQSAKSSEVINITNPFDKTFIGSVPSLASDEVVQAVQYSQQAQKLWAEKTAFERGKLLHDWANLIEQNKQDLAKIMTAEQGKPLKESLAEIDYANSYIRFFAEEGKRVYGDTLPNDKDNLRYMVLKQPIGVCACVTPWNFPSAMIARKVAPALAVGCSMIVKPASQTPFSALALGELAIQAGFPKGILQIVTGKADIVGDVLTTDERIAKFSFTGSTEVGRKLMAQCATSVKKISMELGGNAPFIIFDDADIDKAINGLIASKYRNAGQTCVCANRVYVQKGIKTEFLQRYQAKVANLKVGNGMDNDTDIGALINQQAIDNTKDLIQDAIDKGAKLLIGGDVHPDFTACFVPTILDNVHEKMRIAQSEIFAPVTTIFSFDSEEEVIERANDTIFGLACYFYTNDLKRSWRLSESLEYGIIGQNTGIISTAVAPFGGVKQSGFGKEGSKYGVDDYLMVKYWAVDIT